MVEQSNSNPDILGLNLGHSSAKRMLNNTLMLLLFWVIVTQAIGDTGVLDENNQKQIWRARSGKDYSGKEDGRAKKP